MLINLSLEYDGMFYNIFLMILVCIIVFDCFGICYIFGCNGRWYCIDVKCCCFFV